MEHYKLGDHSKAICEDCNRVVDTTFVVRNVPFFDGSGIVENILVAVCNNCNEVVAIPAQSTAAINAALVNASLEPK